MVTEDVCVEGDVCVRFGMGLSAGSMSLIMIVSGRVGDVAICAYVGEFGLLGDVEV